MANKLNHTEIEQLAESFAHATLEGLSLIWQVPSEKINETEQSNIAFLKAHFLFFLADVMERNRERYG